MSFDALLSIVFILLFVVGPLVRRMAGGQQNDRPQSRGGEREGRQGRAEASGPAGPEPQEPDSNLSRRLEEARRRVLEALGEEEEAEPGRAEPRAETGTPSGRGPLDWQPAPYTVDSGRERPPLDWQASPASSGTSGQTLDWQQSATRVEPFIRRQRRTLAEMLAQDEKPPQVLRTERRRRSPRPAKLRQERIPALDSSGILNGIVWHEILSDPVSRRKTRRQTSRLRSR